MNTPAKDHEVWTLGPAYPLLKDGSFDASHFCQNTSSRAKSGLDAEAPY